jgi:glutamate synthase domain-containing protein 3
MEQNIASQVTIDATGVYYRDLNRQLRDLTNSGTEKITIKNVYGQRYIGTDLDKSVEIEIFGTPGNDLGAFMDGPAITVHGNAQDGTGNTMNEGRIIVHGRAGDITGLSARGGEIYIRDSVGYRAGIHMKEYNEKKPVLVIGGTAQDFVGEYMAGGILVLLGIDVPGGKHKAGFIGTGMHGGVIYYRGVIEEHQLGKEVGTAELNESDMIALSRLVKEYARLFNRDAGKILGDKFTKLYPKYLRPYGRLYAY